MRRPVCLLLAMSLGGALLAATLVLLWAGSTGAPLALAAVACTVPDATHATIQAGINDANCSSVIVKPGTYHENLVISRTLTLQGQNKTTTIIDGGGNGPVIRVTGGAPVIENLTITGGDASNALGCGGGVSIVGAAATVRDNIISGNVASRLPAVEGWGGGVCAMTGTATVYIYNNTIRNNAAFSATTAAVTNPGRGGGIGVWPRHSTVVITGNRILTNVAVRMPPTSGVWGGGGGILSYADVANVVENNIIQGNIANGATGSASGGGVDLRFGAVTFNDNYVLNNLGVYTLTDSPWGSWASGGGVAIYSPPMATLRGNWIMTNTGAVVAQSSASPQDVWAGGGGVAISDINSVPNDHVGVENNHIVGNTLVHTMTASGPDRKGHAEGGGLRVGAVQTTSILSNEVRNNTAVRYMSLSGAGGSDNWGGRPSGGGMHLVNNDTVTLRNNQVLGNTAAWHQVVNEVDSGCEGGGITLSDVGNAAMVGNIVLGNTAVNTGSLHSDSGRLYSAQGGGLRAACGDRPTCSLTMEGNTISDNVASRIPSKSGLDADLRPHGGGIVLYRMDALLRTNIISGNISAMNSANAWGGGINMGSCRVTMERNLILGNRQNSIGRGDAGGVNVGQSTLVTSTNDILARNYSAFSVHDHSRLTLVNDTLHNNTRRGTGFGVSVREQSTLVVSNTIIAWHGVGLQRDNLNPPVVVVEDYNLLYNDTDYEGVPIASRGAHTIKELDPRFVNAVGDDLHLKADSPALNKANGAFAPAVDFYGVSRPQGGGWDIGAVERICLHLPIVTKAQ